MDIDQARHFVSLLANGIDPGTGEIFPDDSPYNQPAVIRSLYTVLTHVRGPRKPPKLTPEEQQRQNLADGKPRNAGLPWTPELKAELAARYKDGKNIPAVAKYFERTESAILSELSRQGLMDGQELLDYRWKKAG